MWISGLNLFFYADLVPDLTSNKNTVQDPTIKTKCGSGSFVDLQTDELVTLRQGKEKRILKLSWIDIIYQGVVGESIYVTVPVSNDFNTSLRLRRAHLLWKFTSEDGGETFSNDKQDNKSPPYVKVCTK